MSVSLDDSYEGALESIFSPFYQDRTPFCDKNFKELRLQAEAIQRFCLTVFYSAIANLFFLFQFGPKSCQRVYNYFTSLSDCQYYKFQYVVAKLKTFHTYGNTVIDFSENGGSKLDDRLWAVLDIPLNDFYIDASSPHPAVPWNKNEELHILQQMYGVPTIANWVKNVLMQKTDKLSAMHAIPGCCYGMSLDFISSYLHEIQSGTPPSLAARAIACDFAEGASDKAQITQIFLVALMNELKASDASKERDRLVKIITDRINEIEQWEESERARIEELSPKKQQKAYSLFDAEGEEKLNELKIYQDSLDKVALKINAWINAIHSTFAKEWGLALALAQTQKFEIEEAQNLACRRDFENFIRNLPYGNYKLTLFGKKNIAHAIAFIKTAQGKHIVFDPNFATFGIDPTESANCLWDLAMRYNYTDFYFTPADLRYTNPRK